MIIVSGHVRTDPAERDSYVARCLAVVEQAREAAGCVDFHISADALEPDRINNYEQWSPSLTSRHSAEPARLA